MTFKRNHPYTVQRRCRRPRQSVKQPEEEKNMKLSLSRRAFVASAMATWQHCCQRGQQRPTNPDPALFAGNRAVHTRNAIIGTIGKDRERPTGKKSRPSYSRADNCFPICSRQGCCRTGRDGSAGSFSLTGIISDADFLQLPVL